MHFVSFPLAHTRICRSGCSSMSDLICTHQASVSLETGVERDHPPSQTHTHTQDVERERREGESVRTWQNVWEKAPGEANKITDATNAPVSDLMFVPFGAAFAKSSLELISIQWHWEKQENKYETHHPHGQWEREKKRKTKQRERESGSEFAGESACLCQYFRLLSYRKG